MISSTKSHFFHHSPEFVSVVFSGASKKKRAIFEKFLEKMEISEVFKVRILNMDHQITDRDCQMSTNMIL